MKTTSALTAKAIRKELQTSYPDIKFTVHSENFAGGNSVHISYTDGPLYDTIDNIVSKYQYGNFDGMQDLYEYNNCREDIPQAKYVTVTRNISDNTRQTIIEKLQRMYEGYTIDGWVESCRCWGQMLIHREFCKMVL